jgi:hypothetical protein
METFWIWLALGGIAVVALKYLFRRSEEDE